MTTLSMSKAPGSCLSTKTPTGKPVQAQQPNGMCATDLGVGHGHCPSLRAETRDVVLVRAGGNRPDALRIQS